MLEKKAREPEWKLNHERDRGAGSRPKPGHRPSDEVDTEGAGRGTGRVGHQVELDYATLIPEVGWEDCGHLWMRSWQSTRIFQFNVLVSMKILVYINLSVD